MDRALAGDPNIPLNLKNISVVMNVPTHLAPAEETV